MLTEPNRRQLATLDRPEDCDRVATGDTSGGTRGQSPLVENRRKGTAHYLRILQHALDDVRYPSYARLVPASVVADRVGPSVDVACGECGERFQLSVRREYAHRSAGTTPKCATCRRPAVPMTESGLEVDELLDISVGLSLLSVKPRATFMPQTSENRAT